MMYEAKKTVKRMGEESYPCEANEDFLLPDYMPEIRRVLRLDAALSPDEPILRTGEAELEGRLLYKLLYTDESGAITEAPLEGHYRVTAPIGEGEDVLLAPYERIESVSFRPVGPRKLSIRTKVRVYPEAYARESALPSLLPPLSSKDRFETLTESKPALTLYSAASHGLEAEFVTRPEGVDPESLRVLASKGDLLIENATAAEGRITLYGTLFAHAVLGADGCAPIVVAKRIAFEAELPCAEAKLGDAILGYGLFDGMDIACEGTGDGAELAFTLRYRVRATGKRNETITYVKDLYAIDQDTCLTMHTVTDQALVGACTGTASIDGEDAAEEGAEGTALLCTVSVRESHLRPSHDKVFIEGEARAEMIVAEEQGVACHSMSFPFRIEVGLATPCADTDTLRYTLHPAYAVGTVQGGRRTVNAEIGYTLSVARPFSLTVPCAVTVTEKEKRDDGLLHVYYPKAEDSLFSVGKAFALPLHRLAAINEMPPLSSEEAALSKSLDGYAWLFTSEP